MLAPFLGNASILLSQKNEKWEKTEEKQNRKQKEYTEKKINQKQS